MQETEWPAIEAKMAADDFQGLGETIQLLMKLPQSLCKMRGHCCKVATFKGSLKIDDIRKIAESDSPDKINATDFLTLFEDYETEEEVKGIAPGFVQRVMDMAIKEGGSTDISFFKCRFLGDDGRCQIHEDRPTGCRVYPFPNEKTIYHPGCGFEKASQESWGKIKTIMNFFDRRVAELNQMQESLMETLPIDTTAPPPQALD